MDVESILDLMPKPDKEDGIVWTPRIIAKKMIDNLPKEVWNHNTKFLDPVCKSGIFLEEILNRLMELDYWKEKYTNIYERRIAVVNKQLFGIAGDKISKAVTDRVLYCQLVDNSNIRYIENYRRIVKNEVLKATIDKEFNGMKFDVIIGNPPYQQEGNGGGGGVSAESSEPLYNKFMEQIMKLSVHYISLIIPSRWCSTDKEVLNNFRRNIIESNHVVEIFNFENSQSVFEDVQIAGGVMYFLYDSYKKYDMVKIHNCEIIDEVIRDISVADRSLREHRHKKTDNKYIYIIVLDNEANKIINKVLKDDNKTLDEVMYRRNVFGISSNFYGSTVASESTPIKVICSKDRETYIDKIGVKNIGLINKYKLLLSRMCGDNGGKKLKVINKVKIAGLNEVCSDSYLVLSCFDTKLECNNMETFIKTKFIRFLIGATIEGVGISVKNFIFVPYLNFNEEWTDEKLYKKFSLTDDEIDYIEQKIRTMD